MEASCDFVLSQACILIVWLIFHSRDFVDETRDFLLDEQQFVSFFLKVSRERYSRLLFPNQTSTLNTKHLLGASITQTVKGFVEEVKEHIYFVHSK